MGWSERSKIDSCKLHHYALYLRTYLLIKQIYFIYFNTRVQLSNFYRNFVVNDIIA